MKSLLPTTPTTRKASRLFFVVLMLMFLQGASCTPGPPPTTPSPTTNTAVTGVDPVSPLEANAASNLMGLINTARQNSGKTMLANGGAGDCANIMIREAQRVVTAWQNAGFPNQFSWDVANDLTYGPTSTNGTMTDGNDWFDRGNFIVAKGYSTSAALFAAIPASFYSGGINRLGVVAINSGTGNDWAIVVARQYQD